MNVEELKRLVYDMSTIIESHRLADVDPTVPLVLKRASRAVELNNDSDIITEDNSEFIESIRKENLHALGT